MTKGCASLQAWLFYSIFPSAVLWSQSSTDLTVHLVGQSTSTDYVAELHSNADAEVSRQMVQGDQLTFLNVGRGRYTLRISDARGRLVGLYPVLADGAQPPVEVRFPAQNEAKPPSGPVPYYRLLHPLDKATRREMLAATKAIDSGDRAAALGHLQSALERNEYIPEAHGWRGALFLQARDLVTAEKELQTAVDQGWRDASVYVNLGILQVLKRDRMRAEAYCRTALSLAPDSAAAKKLAEFLVRK